VVLFGLRFDLRNPGFAGVSMADRYQAALEMSLWAEQHGGLAVSISEHHGSDDGYLPSALPFAAAIAARTSTIAIAINALVAPFYDPLRLAEDIAVIDQLSRGRLSVTLGAGYVAEEFAMFDVALNERAKLMTETVETLRAAWTGEPFAFRGRMVRVTPTPFRDGGPQIVMGGSSEPAARRAARIGDGFIPSVPEVYEFYRDECRLQGLPDPGPWLGGDTTSTFIADDPDAEWEAIGPYLLHETNAYGAWQAQTDGLATGFTTVTDAAQLRAEERYRVLTPEAFLEQQKAVGDLAFVMLHPMCGGIPPELAWRHLELFAERVLRG
jgi:alkanesulfonate monooxygenase SsuD/methylene tetrahydromethanopterin reductase-like flavin-dependent oxidoreductase (luciferase family)